MLSSANAEKSGQAFWSNSCGARTLKFMLKKLLEKLLMLMSLLLDRHDEKDTTSLRRSRAEIGV